LAGPQRQAQLIALKAIEQFGDVPILPTTARGHDNYGN
jgi:hypothetical protein